jgi:hypothetical protein
MLVAGVLGLACATGGDGQDKGVGLGDPTAGSTGGTAANDDGTPGDDDDGADTTGTSSNCDSPLTFHRDADGDGYGAADDATQACDPPAGYVPDSTDCDDDDDTIHPGATESCGGPDRDCDFTPPPLCQSCLSLLASGNGDRDGLYQIDPDGAGKVTAQQVYCEQTTDGGGWTLVQRTVWDPAQTDALNTGYAAWHDITVGTPGRGAYRMQGGLWPTVHAQQELMVQMRVRDAGDGEDCDPLSYLGTNGVLTVTESSAALTGLQSDATLIDAPDLTTLDSGPSPTCIGNGGVPWFYGGCCATCPTYASQYWPEPHPMASYPDDTPDAAGLTANDVCRNGPQLSVNESANYVGLNVMAIYLR